ncbi:MAG: acyl-CoA desaturase [Elusimicrobiota bacterium]
MAPESMLQANPTRPLDFVNIAFLTFTPIIAVFGTFFYSLHFGVSWLDVCLFVFMYLGAGLGITAGYHRYYAHRSHACSKALQLFYLVFGATAVQNSALNWAADHRNHHRFVDSDNDPYSISKGGFYAHMGWIFYRDTRASEVRYRRVPDLLKDPLVMWQHRWYLPLVVIVGFGLPTFLGALGGHALGGLLWGGFLRMVVCHHMTFLVNSAAHLWGKRPYSLENSAKDNWMLAPLTFGEGYHNFHHKFPSDWRNGVKWYQFDLTKWWLALMKWSGLISELRRTPDPLVLKARLQIEFTMAKRKILAAELDWNALAGAKIHPTLKTAKSRVESAVERYHEARMDYAKARRVWSLAMREDIAKKLDVCRGELRSARASWDSAMKLFNRLAYSGAAKNFMTVAAALDILKNRV